MNHIVRRVFIVAVVSSSLFIGSPEARMSAGVPRQSAPSGLPPEARQFDFWLGRWNLAVAGSSAATRAFITPFGLGGGIAVLEDFGVGQSTSGTSLSLYSPKTGKWYQTWYDTDQLLIEVAGGFQNGRMILDGVHLGTANGQRLGGRMTYSDITARGLNYLYEVSNDGGRTWTASFSARLTGMSAAPRVSPSFGFGNDFRQSAAKPGTFAPAALPSGFRQLDFTVGTWKVNTSDRPGSGVARISPFGLGGGFAVLEELKGPDGYVDTSVSLYNTAAKSWRQIRFDSNGRHLDLVGQVESGKAALTGDAVDSETGNPVQLRMTFDSATPAGFERKVEISSDAGQSWTLQSTAQFVKETLLAPEDVRAAKVKDTKVGLTWADVSSAETRFEVLQRNGAEWTVVKTVGANTTAATVKKLQSGTTYRFAVRACDSGRCSEQTEVTVTTP